MQEADKVELLHLAERLENLGGSELDEIAASVRRFAQGVPSETLEEQKSQAAERLHRTGLLWACVLGLWLLFIRLTPSSALEARVSVEVVAYVLIFVVHGFLLWRFAEALRVLLGLHFPWFGRLFKLN
mgnify:FL=1